MRSNVKPAQIIIADGGGNLKSIIDPFTKIIKLCVLRLSYEAGQILQRNYAHKHLLPSIQMVMHLDDDITFDQHALNRMIDFWNNPAHHQGKPLAGASFNLIDIPKLRNSPCSKTVFFSTPNLKSLISVLGMPPFLPGVSNSRRGLASRRRYSLVAGSD